MEQENGNSPQFPFSFLSSSPVFFGRERIVLFNSLHYGHGYGVPGVGGVPGMIVGGPGMPSGPGGPGIVVDGVPGVPGV